MRKLFLGISIIFMFFEMIFAKHCDPVKEFCEYKNIEEYDNDDSSFHNSTVFNFENTVGVINRGGFESGNLEELDIVNQTSYDVPWMKICSGTLIGPDLFLTAAHCIKDKPADEDDPFNVWDRQQILDHWYVTFNYQINYRPPMEPRFFHYKIIEVVEEIYENSTKGPDLAVLRLASTDIDGVNILPGNRFGYSAVDDRIDAISTGTPLAVIAYPAHYPEKISTGTVDSLKNDDKDIYFDSIDIFGGSSGGGTFNENKKLVGAVKGYTPSGCFASSIYFVVQNRCSDMPVLCSLSYNNDIDDDEIINGIDPCPFDAESFDSDEDGIPDVCDPDIDGDNYPNAEDNCPYVINLNQNDFNEDGIGDKCSDLDNDGKMDYEDNCPVNWNPDQSDIDEDWVGDVCDLCPNEAGQGTLDSDNDGVADACDNCKYISNPFEIANHPYSELIIRGAAEKDNGYWAENGNLGKVYMWQPDTDLDGIGDACDQKTADGSAGGYSVSMAWKSKDSLTALFGQNTSNQVYEFNKTISVSVAGGYFNPVEETCVTMPPNGVVVCMKPDGLHRVHYCGLDLAEYCEQGMNPEETGCAPGGNRWSDLCQTEEVDERAFGRSHATVTNVMANGRERWPHIAWADTRSKADKINHINIDQYKQPVPAPQNMSKIDPSAYWNWRADIYVQYNCSDPQSGDTYAICGSEIGKVRQNTPIFYTLSSNMAGANDNYLNGNSINPQYFKNNATGGSFNDAGKWGMATRLNVESMKVKYTKFAPDINDLKTSFRNIIKEIPWEGSAYNTIVPLSALALQEMSFVRYQHGGYVKEIANDYSLIESAITALPSTRQIIEGDRKGVTYLISMEGDNFYNFYVNYAPSSDWHKMGEITNYHDYDLRWSSAAIYNKTVYLAGGEDNEATLIKHLYKIVRSGEDYVVQMVFPTLVDGSDIRLISALGKLFIISDSNGQFSTWSVNPEEGTYSAVTTGSFPAFRRPLNIIGTETGIYIAGKYDPADQNNTVIAKFTENTGWQIIYNNIAANTDKLIMNVVDDKVMMTDIMSETPETTRIELNLVDDSIVIEDVETSDIYGIAESYGSYCLNETGTLIKGGLEMSGECMPFTHPWYRSFATGSTIYSVAGKGDRLYVGTNNSIKVYDISDPNTLVLKSTFSTGGRIVYDLEVAENDIMYAATSGGIYKLNTANPDTLSSLSFFATSYNYQYRIQLYNDKLYVGDDNGINIRDKETFARLAYVNIDSVLDFAIANGEIALYRSSFWSAGLHIRDVETLNLKAYEYAECYTGELTTDHGAFYLSCDGYEYRFEGRPDTYFNFYPLDGDIREMQENHVYNGWTYIPDGSSVKLSTLNDVPSYCGNGVIEPGELCDGNSVACTTISSSFVSGTAYCNSTCNGYNESNCSTDGW